MKTKKPTPFAFILDHLLELDPLTKPMFGCTAVYVYGKIVLILRQKKDFRRDNGVWLATTVEHHEALRIHFPSMRSISLLSSGPTAWQNLPEDSSDFEESVVTACELICKKSPLIGKIPAEKKKQKKTFEHAKTKLVPKSSRTKKKRPKK